MFDVSEVIASGLSATRLRVNTIASNIANAETTRTASGGPYKRKDIVQAAISMPSDFSNVLDRVSLAKPAAVAVIEDQSEARKIFNPSHPDADKEGFVAMPNINVVTEMTNLMSATRLYQANVTTLETTRSLIDEAKRISSSY